MYEEFYPNEPRERQDTQGEVRLTGVESPTFLVVTASRSAREFEGSKGVRMRDVCETGGDNRVYYRRLHRQSPARAPHGSEH